MNFICYKTKAQAPGAGFLVGYVKKYYESISSPVAISSCRTSNGLFEYPALKRSRR